MRFLIFGVNGQVGRELQRLAPDAIFLDRASADLSNPEVCAAAINGANVDAVINAAAYTAVDRAENDVATATIVNTQAPAIMAQAAAARGVSFLHISTDYVFDGSGSAAWAVGAPKAPLNVYGQTKLAGEQGVRAAGGCHAILRTSWVFSAHNANFVKTMLRLGSERETLNVVADQIGGPTAAADIAGTLLAIAKALSDDRDLGGTYHYSGTGDVSWADFAREICLQARLDCKVTDIPTSAYPTAAARPHNSRLDCSTLETTFGITRPDWKVSLHRVLAALDEEAIGG